MISTIRCCTWCARSRARAKPQSRNQLEEGGPMEFQLKSISLEGVDEALSKVETYRFLNQPEEAESICHDVLAIAPGHQLALRLLGLAITDQFSGGPSDRYADAENIFQQLNDPYERLYYAGLLHERRSKAQLQAG